MNQLKMEMKIKKNNYGVENYDQSQNVETEINNMLEGGDERPLWLWCFVSFSPPRCEFFTSRTKTERATMREAYAFAVQEPS